MYSTGYNVQESLAAIATYKQKMAEREIAIQNAVKKQMMDLEASFQGLQKKLDGAAQELAQVKRQSSEHEESLQKQIEKVFCPHWPVRCMWTARSTVILSLAVFL